MSAMGKAFVVYVGTHGDAGAHRADVILPGAAYTEKSATYVNTEGRVQVAGRAVFPPGDAKEEWAIFRALSAVIGMPLPFNSLRALRQAMYAEFPHLAQLGQIVPAPVEDVRRLAAAPVKTNEAPLVAQIGDFYMTNPIARASAIMAECSQEFSGLRQAAE
jgi:NADH-quinone oxidoreductase subunit G